MFSHNRTLIGQPLAPTNAPPCSSGNPANLEVEAAILAELHALLRTQDRLACIMERHRHGRDGVSTATDVLRRVRRARRHRAVARFGAWLGKGLTFAQITTALADDPTPSVDSEELKRRDEVQKLFAKFFAAASRPGADGAGADASRPDAAGPASAPGGDPGPHRPRGVESDKTNPP